MARDFRRQASNETVCRRPTRGTTDFPLIPAEGILEQFSDWVCGPRRRTGLRPPGGHLPEYRPEQTSESGARIGEIDW